MKVFTKFLCSLLTVAMLFSVPAVFADVTPLAITEQPTFDSPSVAVNATENVTYQWYVSTAVSKGALNNCDVRPITPDSEITDGYSLFDNNTGIWTPSCIDGFGEFFVIDLKAGDSITVFVEGSIYEVGLINYELLDDYAGVINDDGSYTITVEADASYTCYVYAENAEDITLIAYGSTHLFEALDGETKKKLSNVEFGKHYYCLVSRGDEAVKSNVIAGEYAITRQPSISNPSVKVTYPQDVKSYQWYKDGMDNIDITDTTKNIIKHGTYDNTTSSWIPYIEYDGQGDSVMWVFDKYFYADDIVTVTVEGGEVTTVWISNLDTDMATSTYIDENGQSVIGVSDDGLYRVIIEAPTTDLKVRVSAYTVTELPIEDETDKALSNTAFKEKYCCKITYKDGTELWSEKYEHGYGIIRQPSAVDSSVTVTFDTDVKSYQWGTVHVGDKLVTDKDAIPSTELHASQEGQFKSTYDAATGLWTPVEQSHHTNSDYGKVPNRIYFCQTDTDFQSVNAFFFNNTSEYISATDWPGTPMTQIDNTDYWYVDVPEGFTWVIFNDYNKSNSQTRDLSLTDDFGEDNCYVMCTGSFESYYQYVDSHLYQLGLFDITVKKGETISFEFNGPLYEDMIWNGLGPNIYMDENGQYEFTASRDTQCSFYVYKTFTEPLTVKVTLENTDVFTPIEGANKRTFMALEENTYGCVITYKDGTVLKTDKVVLQRSEYADMDGDINGDGSFDMFDYFLIKSIYFDRYDPTEQELANADVNGDGFVDTFDYLAIKTLFFIK